MVISAFMSLRVHQILVFVGTVVVIFGLFATGIVFVAKRLTTEATLQTALLLARQVEIALAQSLHQAPTPAPPPAANQPKETPRSSFWPPFARRVTTGERVGKRQERIRAH